MSKWANDEVVQRFREYLKIPSVQPDVDYGDCVKFLQRQATEIGLSVAVHELVPRKPVVVLTWPGTEPALPSILLNSHMDVVPVYIEHWTHPPFEAHVTEDGWIYARGAQDMKSVGMIHLETVRRLKQAGVTLRRTVHVSFVPDEEIGGADGMGVFAESEEFKQLNVGFEMDESAPCPQKDKWLAFHGERTCRQIKVTCRGSPGHGSLIESDSAGEKMAFMIEKFMKFRAEENKKYTTLETLGELTTINLTMMEGGVQVNVTPETLSVYFDIRIAPHVDHDEFEKMIERWCAEAGKGVTFEYLKKNPQVINSRTDSSVPFFGAAVDAAKKMGIEIKCVVCPGTTDARYVRLQGIPAINLTPINNTPLMLHCHDEKLHVEEYKKGIVAFENILKAVANV